MLYDFLYVTEFALACEESTKPLETQIVVYRTRMRTTYHLPYIADSISSRSSRCIGASKGFSAGHSRVLSAAVSGLRYIIKTASAVPTAAAAMTKREYIAISWKRAHRRRGHAHCASI